jgi:hypothetical protein
MIPVLVCVDDLRDVEPELSGAGQTLLVIQGIDSKSLARVAAGDQIVKIAKAVTRPDLLDNHVCAPCSGWRR